MGIFHSPSSHSLQVNKTWSASALPPGHCLAGLLCCQGMGARLPASDFPLLQPPGAVVGTPALPCFPAASPNKSGLTQKDAGRKRGAWTHSQHPPGTAGGQASGSTSAPQLQPCAPCSDTFSLPSELNPCTCSPWAMHSPAPALACWQHQHHPSSALGSL